MSEILTVDGKQKRIFPFGGHEFYVPAKIGAGYRDAVGQREIDAMLDVPRYAKRLAELKPGPKAATELEKIIRDFSRDFPAKVKLCVIIGLVTPVNGAPSDPEEIEQLYMEEATQEEANAIVNFFSTTANVKIENALPKTRSGGTTRRTSTAQSR